MTVTDPASGAEAIAWDLSDLLGEVVGPPEASVDALLDEADRRADVLAGARGEVASFDVERLRSHMAATAELGERLGRAGSYAMLRYTVDTADAASGALVQHVQERSTGIETKLLFFDLEWAALDDDRAAELLADDRLDFCRHHLERV